MLGWLAAYTPADRTRFRVLLPFLPLGGALYNKRGSLATPWVVVGDAGLLVWPIPSGQRVWAYAFFGFPAMDGATTYEHLEATLEQAARRVGAFLLAESAPWPPGTR